MKHSIRKEDVTYVVNPEKKTVVAYIEKTENMFIKFVEENSPKLSWLLGDYLKPLEKFKMPNKFYGIATCGPDDEWDEQVGRLIAFDRMKDNLNKSFFKRANTFADMVAKQLDNFIDITNAYGAKLEHNTLRRKDVINEVLNSKE